MKRVLGVLVFCLLSLLVIVGLGSAFFGYFVYSPAPEVPQLSGTLAKGSIDAGGLRRTYTTYVPSELPKGSPLVVVMHGSGENAARIRIETGYGFDRLADRHHFAVVYPNAHAHGGDWNACGTVGDASADGPGIDDVGFLTGVVGGEISLLGFFYKYGKVMSSRKSAQYFADLNHLAAAPETKETQVADGVRVEQVLWRNESKEVELVALHGGGHGIPQPYRRHPRLLGPSPKEPNGPDVIWAFFERQR